MLLVAVEVTLTLGWEMQTEYRTRWAPDFSVAYNWFIALFLYNIECASLCERVFSTYVWFFFSLIFLPFLINIEPKQTKVTKVSGSRWRNFAKVNWIFYFSFEGYCREFLLFNHWLMIVYMHVGQIIHFSGILSWIIEW